MNNLLARIDIPIHESLDACAARLNRLIPGFTFEEDVEGRYDEFPAFEAECGGMKFVLFGIPLDEEGAEYELKFKCRTDLPLPSLLDQDEGGFIRRFVHEKEVNERGFLDYSEELAQLLVECGIPGCKPILPVQT
jgi:hypothetical protein